MARKLILQKNEDALYFYSIWEVVLANGASGQQIRRKIAQATSFSEIMDDLDELLDEDEERAVEHATEHVTEDDEHYDHSQWMQR